MSSGESVPVDGTPFSSRTHGCILSSMRTSAPNRQKHPPLCLMSGLLLRISETRVSGAGFEEAEAPAPTPDE